MNHSSQHWTAGELIAHLYGVGPEGDHLASCPECRERLSELRANRVSLETSADVSEAVDREFLAAQRRRIYARVDEPRRAPWRMVSRWTAAATAVLVLAGGTLLFEHNHQTPTPAQAAKAAANKVSDEQLADDVSDMVAEPEPPSAAPLKGLFAE